MGELMLRGSLTARKIGAPRIGLWWKLSNFPRLVPGLWRMGMARLTGVPTFFGTLHARLLKADGRVVDYGLVSTRLITNAFVDFMVAQLQTETSEWGDFKYHDSGIGVTPAAVGDTAIETTAGEARVAGSQEEGASTNIYKSIGTVSYTTTKAVTEHGLFSQLEGTTLMDHHVFSALNVENGDSIQYTYNLTCSAGG